MVIAGRHSMGDWSQPDYDKYPLLREALYVRM